MRGAYEMDKIAIIPARSGSKGLKDKNIINLCGKPMLVYSIEAAVKCGKFKKIIVSTDSEKYAQIAREAGAEILLRDEHLSNDLATTYMVIEDVLKRLNSSNDYFVLLQPTSPLRTEIYINQAIELFEANFARFDFLVSMKEAEYAGVLVKPVEEDLSLKHFNVDFSNYRRQGYKEYSPNGAIFMGKPTEYLIQKHFFGARSMAYFMDKKASMDIDDRLDYEIVEYIMKMQGGQ